MLSTRQSAIASFRNQTAQSTDWLRNPAILVTTYNLVILLFLCTKLLHVSADISLLLILTFHPSILLLAKMFIYDASSFSVSIIQSSIFFKLFTFAK